jgi:multiple sugar transport system permease protein
VTTTATAPLSVPAARRIQRRPLIGSNIFLLVLTVAFLAPVAWAILSAFKPAGDIIRDPLGFDPTTFTLDNFRGMFQDVPIASGFLNTGIVLVVKGSITLFCAPLAAYAFA